MAVDPWLLGRLRDAEARPYVGEVWRVTLGDRPITRPNTRGARWNPPGTTALYTSLTEACARAEMRFLLDAQPIRPSVPLTTSRLLVNLERVLNLSTAERVRRCGVDLALLEEGLPGHPPCQRIGGAAASLLFEGMLVPSVRMTEGVNLVIFTANVVHDRSRVTLQESRRLSEPV